ncbi:histidine phosphatase family protein [Archangium violaceum]|uniref:phosphoglycerate mutase family protein n=1 Tax=Archangium violaceum TaxID=83451 RepID=UPI00194E91E3|nr:phosphoglycerate mutase family protein [Archangium violaceum]QRN94090.1 histidine phosphatase family protein [Archangium violaceum]
MRTTTPRLLLLACLLPLAACTGAHSTSSRVEPSSPPSASTVVVLVRHAEKATEGGDDPALTPAGQQRAEALLQVAGNAGVSAIYATQYRRTRDTAQPLADQVGVPVTVREIKTGAQAHASEVAREILSQHQGRTVLVVEHSNTLPSLIEALAGLRIQPIPDTEYDRLMVVVIPPSGPARLIQSRYGVPSVIP